MRSIGQLRKTGHESDRDLHLAWNSGIPIADPDGGFFFVFMAGAPAFRKYDDKGELIYERVVQGREIDPLVAAIPDRWPRRGAGELPLVAPIDPDRGRRSIRQAVDLFRHAVFVRLRPGRRENPDRPVPGRGRRGAVQPLVQRKGPGSGHTRVL